MGLPGTKWIAFLLSAWLLPALPAFAGRGDLFLDLGVGSFVQEKGRQPAMAGTMGFRFGANERTELNLGVDYGRFLNFGDVRQMELTGLSMAASLTPYPGDLQPLIGAHLGMIRLDGAWRADMGLEAQALASLHDRFQGYFAVNPGLWIGEEGPQIWVKVGLGLRMRLGY